jgi:hypothetical protein
VDLQLDLKKKISVRPNEKIIHWIHFGEGEKTFGFTAMAMSPGSKRFIAVAEKGTTTAFVTIYDVFTLRKKKVLSTPECASKVFI